MGWGVHGDGCCPRTQTAALPLLCNNRCHPPPAQSTQFPPKAQGKDSLIATKTLILSLIANVFLIIKAFLIFKAFTLCA